MVVVIVSALLKHAVTAEMRIDSATDKRTR